MEPPDPTGERPPDWPPDQWTGWQMLHAGDTRRDVANEVGVSAGTVGGWVMKWRKKYGNDLFREQATANRLAAQSNLPPPPLRGYRPPKEWAEPIEALAALDQIGRAGEQARLVISTMLDRIAHDDERLTEAKIDDVRYLAQIHKHLAESAVVWRAVGQEPERDDGDDSLARILSLVDQLGADAPPSSETA